MSEIKGLRTKGVERVAQILAATETLLLERSFEDLTLTEIAQEAGLARTLVYHFFPSKHDIFEALSARYYDALKERCIAYFDPEAELDLRAACGGVAGVYARYFNENPVAAKLLLGSSGGGGQVFTAARPEASFSKVVGQLVAGRTSLARRDVDQGAFPDVVQVSIELMSTLFSFWIRKEGRISERISDDAADLAASYLETMIVRRQDT